MHIDQVLEKVGKFAFLNDIKVRSGGYLPPGDAKRWSELRAFYGMLMEQDRVWQQGDTGVTSDRIRRSVKWRERLRVSAELPAILTYKGGYLVCDLVNVSCGGAFLSAPRTLPAASVISLVIPAHGYEVPACEVSGEVVWTNGEAFERLDCPQGMGVRFLRVQNPVKRRLDWLVVEALKRRLS